MDRGGWEVQFTVMNDTDMAELYQQFNLQLRGAFGSTPGAPRPVFQGYIVPQQFTFDRTSSETRHIAQTSDGILRKGWLQGLGLADRDVTPRDHYHQWDSVTGGAAAERLTMGRIVRHILGHYDQLGVPPASNPDWISHTNLVYHPTENPLGWITLDNVEVEPFDVTTYPEGSMRVNFYNVRETDNLWERLKEIADNEFFAIYFDKQDNLYYQRHPMYRTILPVPVMTFDEDFCVTPPTVEFRNDEFIRQVRLHAVTDDGDTIHAYYPYQNICFNPSFETDITDWTAVGGAAISQSAAFAHEGLYSMQIVNTVAVGDGAFYSSNPGARKTTFIASIWVYQAAGGATVRARLRDQTNAKQGVSAAAVLAPATWTQFTATVKTGSNPCTDLRLYIETTVGAISTLYVDAAVITPPSNPVYSKKLELSYIRCNDQATLNNWAMRRYLYENRPYTVKWTAPGLCGLLFDLLDRVQITYTGTTANGVAIDWVEQKFWIHEITVTPSEGFTGTTTFLLEAENLEIEQ